MHGLATVATCGDGCAEPLVDTDPLMKQEVPPATADEERSLRIVIEDWETRSSVQQAICLALLRGHDNHATIAQYLGMDVEDVQKNLNGVWGVLYDASTDKLWLK